MATLVPSMRSLVIDVVKRQIGPAFVALELVMHLYLSVYLTFHWTNWTIWGFTAFETVGFIYLLAVGRKKKSGGPTEQNMRHYQYCGCLCERSKRHGI